MSWWRGVGDGGVPRGGGATYYLGGMLGRREEGSLRRGREEMVGIARLGMAKGARTVSTETMVARILAFELPAGPVVFG